MPSHHAHLRSVQHGWDVYQLYKNPHEAPFLYSIYKNDDPTEVKVTDNIYEAHLYLDELK